MSEPGWENLYLTLQPGQFRPVPLPSGLGECPDEDVPLYVQLVRRTIRVELDEHDRPTGRVAAEGLWHQPGEPGPQLVHLLVLASALPEGTVPELPGGGPR